jgi:gliding motility-associated-like protein
MEPNVRAPYPFLRFLAPSLLVLVLSPVHLTAQCTQVFDLGPDISLCEGQSTLLNAGPGYLNYLWNTGATTQTLLATTPGTYTVQVQAFDTGTNLVVNGNFSQGLSGFTSNYTIGTGGPWGALSNEGTYTVSTNPQSTHTGFQPCGDHTSGNGNMLVVNGASLAGSSVWCQTVNVAPNTQYAFSAWLTSVHPESPAQLQFTINGVPVGNPLQAAPGTCNWNQFYSIWNSGAATVATLCIANQNTGTSGNDFALDDIAFVPFCTYTDEVVVDHLPYPEPDLGPDPIVCTGTELVFDASVPGGSYAWHTGSTSGTLTSIQPGVHWVDVTVNGCTARDSVFVTHLPMPVVNLGPDQQPCEGGTFLLSAFQPNAVYQWHDGSVQAVFPVTTSGTFWVMVDLQGCQVSDTVSFTFSPLPVVDLGPDTLICTNAPWQVDVSVPDASYLWQNGATVAVQEIDASGTFWVEVTLDGCSVRDSVVVEAIDLPEVDLGPDVDLCLSEWLVLDARGPGYSYLWQDGSTGATYHVVEGASYTVTVSNPCGQATDDVVITSILCDCPVYAPNAFTPDGDDINDLFIPQFDCGMLDYHLLIHDRWGRAVFETRDPQKPWDGAHQSGGQLPDGIYGWTLDLRSDVVNDRDRRILRGHVLLVR